MDVQKYLDRIQFSKNLICTDEVLKSIHQLHVHQIPFENLDIYYKKIFNLDIESVFKKVVINNRGGFCYELNLLFDWLLNSIGFTSRIISARIFNDDGTLGPQFDHMCVYVKTNSDFLVDVGFGDLFVLPLEIKNGVQFDGRNYFQIEKLEKNDFLLSMSADGIDFKKKYIFNLEFVNAKDFESICFDKQTNPSSYFVQNVICTKPTKTGRITIFNNKFIEKITDSRFETPINDNEEMKIFLKEKFRIEIN